MSDARIVGALSFKHCRNAAPTVAYRVLRSRDLADAVLGHAIGTEAEKYVGDLEDPRTLLELVERIGETYPA